MHESTDGFPVKNIRIYSYPDVVYLLTGVRSWPSRATCSLWMSRMVLSESPVASAVRFTTAILLMVDLHAFSFSKKARTFSTICLLCDLSLTPFLRPFSRVFGLLCVAVSYWSYRLPQWTFFLGPFLRIMYNYYIHMYGLCI